MASNINPNNINGNYPVAGQDNDSQGFRDNFTNISNNFSFAQTEITALQNAMTNVQTTVATDGNVTAYYGNIQQGLLVGGQTTLTGDATFGSNVILADSSLSTLSAVYPSTNRGYDLGTSALQFGNIHTANVNANISSATSSVSYYQVGQTNIVSAAPTSTQAIDTLSGSRWLFTTNAASNTTLNVRGSASTAFADTLAVGQTTDVEVLITQGATPYYPSAFQIDAVAQTSIKWKDGFVPTTGNANSVNSYTYTITKTAATPTYTIFASQSRYA